MLLPPFTHPTRQSRPRAGEDVFSASLSYELTEPSRKRAGDGAKAKKGEPPLDQGHIMNLWNSTFDACRGYRNYPGCRME